MLRSKLFRLLLTFSKKERTAFRAFLESPFHNEQEDALKLFNAISKLVAAKKPKDLDENQWFTTTFPEREVDAVFIRNQKHALLKAAKRFLAQQLYELDAQQQARYYLQDARGRNSGIDFDKEWEAMEEAVSELLPTKYDPSTYYHHFQLGMEQVKARAKSEKRSADSFLRETMLRLDDFYLLQKLQLACALLNQRGIVRTQDTIPGPSMELFWEMEEPPKSDLHNLYHLVYRMLAQPNESLHFDQLVRALLQPDRQLPTSTFIELFLYAINRSMQHVNLGTPQAKESFIGLFKQAQQRPEFPDLLKERPMLSKNVVQVAARLGDTDFAQNVATQAANADYPIAEIYNDAVIQFYLCKAKSATKLFQKVLDDAKDRFFYLDALVHLLLLDYLAEDERMEALYNRLRMHLQRNEEIAEPHKQKFKAFQSFLLQLAKISPRDAQALRLFREQCRQEDAWTTFVWVFDWITKMQKQ
jgi:hypothetical protein